MSTAPVTPGRCVLTLVGLTTAVGCYLADFSHTHIFNPRWPPHAKFHTGQTMSMGLCLGLSTLYYTWRRSHTLSSERDSLNIATWLGSMYWITQLSAAFYPNTLPVDPEFGEGFPQLYLCMGLYGLIGTAYYLESSRISMAEKSGKNL